MKLGMIGLGKMGASLVKNLLHQEIEVVAYDLDETAVKEVEQHGAIAVSSIKELVNSLDHPRIVWVMVPSGEPTNQAIDEVVRGLTPGDIVIDGGNSFYEASKKQYQKLNSKGIHFFDVGTSGGTNGALNGGNFMIGGDEKVFPEIEEIFQKISEKGGYLFTGESGSGHYLKMVHNGIEYGMMQAIGEGFELLEKSPYDYQFEDVAQMWNHGSVVRSWLMELAAQAFHEDGKLEKIRGVVQSSGEGLWTVEEGLKRQVPLPVITTSLMMRYRTLEEDTFSGKVVAALRNGFGGHEVTKK